MKRFGLLAVFLTTSAHSLTTYPLASKCVHVEDSSITRIIGATSGVWVRALADCKRLGKIAANTPLFKLRTPTNFPGLEVSYECHKIDSEARWREVGCSGGLELGYLLEVSVKVERPDPNRWYYPESFVTDYASARGVHGCREAAQSFIWFGTDRVVTEAECRVEGTKVTRMVRLRFIP